MTPCAQTTSNRFRRQWWVPGAGAQDTKTRHSKAKKLRRSPQQAVTMPQKFGAARAPAQKKGPRNEWVLGGRRTPCVSGSDWFRLRSGDEVAHGGTP